MWQAIKDFLTNGPATTDRAPTWLTGSATLTDRERRRREKQRPGYTLSFRGQGSEGRAGLIEAAKWFSRGR